MTEQIRIRRAVKEDCPRILELVKELACYEKAPGEVTVTLDHFTQSGFGEKPVWWAFVATSPTTAESGREIIHGFALYYIRFSTWKGQRMYLEDLLVTEQMRGKGIGMLLMNELIKEAKDKQLSAIVWQVLEWNEPAINFYKKLNASFDAEWVNCSIAV
jgi:GNAT superfamily N-acetyltransferase